MSSLSKLQAVIDDVIAPTAAMTDANASFPRENIDRLAEAGLLGLVSSTEAGGEGLSLAAAAEAVRRIGEHCASTGMIMCMHYAATAVIEAFGDDGTRQEIAAGRHLSTLAFSEAGSRNHFWAPMSTATTAGEDVALDAKKSWVTSASFADSYVWSSRPAAAEGMSTIWLVPRSTTGIKVDGAFDGLGLRGNDSCPVSATDARIPGANRLGEDGAGFDIMMGTVLPWFSVMNASNSVGIMHGAINAAAGHLGATRLEHLDQTLADNPVNRLRLARAKVVADQAATLVADALAAIGSQRDDTMLRVLEAKAAAGDAAIEVTDACMRICGGAAFRREVGVERRFRDARAAAVMAPTSDVLYDFIGKALCDMPLF